MARPDQFLPGSRRFALASGRLLLLAAFTGCLWASGLVAGAWAATTSLEAVRAGRDVSPLPWLLPFVLVVSGMLSVVYGFFFRPRGLEMTGEEVALIMWDGKGRSMRRGEVEAVESDGSGLLLKGAGGVMRVPRLFEEWKDLEALLRGWVSAPAPAGARRA